MSLTLQETNHYLDAMGIIAWRERRSDCVSFTVQLNGVFIALYASLEGARLIEQQALWNNLKESLCFIVSDSVCESADRAVIFGTSLRGIVNAAQQCVTHSLEEILSNPELKADVWHAIKDQATV